MRLSSLYESVGRTGPAQRPYLQFLEPRGLEVGAREALGVESSSPEHMLAAGSGMEVSKALRGHVLDAAFSEIKSFGHSWKSRQLTAVTNLGRAFYRGFEAAPALVWCHYLGWSRGLALRLAQGTRTELLASKHWNFQSRPQLPYNSRFSRVLGARDLLENVAWEFGNSPSRKGLMGVWRQYGFKGAYSDDGWSTTSFQSMVFPADMDEPEHRDWLRAFSPSTFCGRVHALGADPVVPVAFSKESRVSGAARIPAPLKEVRRASQFDAEGGVMDMVILKFVRCLPLFPWSSTSIPVERLVVGLDRCSGNVLYVSTEGDVEIEAPDFEHTAFGRAVKTLRG